ncbi:MAG: Signal peptidase I S [candidate division WS6 bacterium OLB20]|uniref:Signal peptidase I n=1 Tax=candidate division WS6 bacterium OLB20 TaxID=1617426 RepID=A0A136LVY7_9BACT|nr:MAG: Signal peptidase I S [candidate division WS6 bacterium OLB20]
MATEVKTNEYFYTESAKSGAGSRIISVLQVIAVVLVVFVLLYLVILLPNQVDGQSMEPNFLDKEQLFTDKIINMVGTTGFGQAQGYDYGRGDVVVFPFGEISLIKRIVAIGGDTVRIEGGRVYLNGILLDEEYIDPSQKPTAMPFSQATFPEGVDTVVPEGTYFVLGDNRPNSKDSRFADIGFLKREQLSGRVFIRYWPPDRFGLIGRGKTNVSPD